MQQPPNTVVENSREFRGRPVKKFAGTPGDYGLQIMQFGYPNEFWWQYNIFKETAKNGGSFVEIGAHFGTTTLYAADEFKNVFAYEPSSRNLSILRYNIEINGAKNIQTSPLAFSDAPGAAKFFLGPDNCSACHSLAQAVVPHARTEDVEITTLDLALPEMTDCSMLQIDTEGYDIKVLLGGKQFIRRQKVQPLIMIEFAPRMLVASGSTAKELNDFIAEFNYDVFYNAGGNLNSPISSVIITELFDIWKNCKAWADFYLVPRGMYAGLFGK